MVLNLKVKTKLEAFFASDFYLLLITAICILFWVINQTIAGLAIFAVLMLLMSLTCKNMNGALAILGGFMYLIADQRAMTAQPNITILVVSVVIMCASVLVFYVKNRVKLRFSPALIGFGLLLFAGIFGGITEGHFGSTGWLIGVGICLALGAVFFIASNAISFDAKFFANIFVCVAIVVLVQTWIYLFRQDDFMRAIMGKAWATGWGNSSNDNARILTMCLPFVLFSASKTKLSFLHIGLFFALLFTILFTMSRGNVLIIAIFTVPLLIYGLIISKHKALFLIYLAVWIAVAVALF
ncbi:MAG: hypothetical protein FWD49_03175, partial [Firmicutes bacterium]|nr:hypothetical protein [Bacillota bacterium]